MKASSKLRNDFASRSRYFETKGHAVNDFDGLLQGFDLSLCRNSLDFYGDEGRKVIPIFDNDGAEQKFAACLSWYRMPSGAYEFTGYLT